MVGIYGCDYRWVEYNRDDDHRKGTFRAVGSFGNDDVPDLYSLDYESDSAV